MPNVRHDDWNNKCVWGILPRTLPLSVLGLKDLTSVPCVQNTRRWMWKQPTTSFSNGLWFANFEQPKNKSKTKYLYGTHKLQNISLHSKRYHFSARLWKSSSIQDISSESYTTIYEVGGEFFPCTCLPCSAFFRIMSSREVERQKDHCSLSSLSKPSHHLDVKSQTGGIQFGLASFTVLLLWFLNVT